VRRGAAPTHGGHGSEILRELGFTDDEIARLADEGGVRLPD